MQLPNKPTAQPVTLDSTRTVVLVLDLSAHCEDHSNPCSELLPTTADLLQKARGAGVPIVFTTSLMHKGTPFAEVAAPLARGSEEPLLQPDGFDKFTDGSLRKLLTSYKAENVVIIGWATSMAVMYTATTAARVDRLQVVIPLDGVNGRNDYEHEYALHQLSTLPSPPARAILFSAFSLLTFA